MSIFEYASSHLLRYPKTSYLLKQYLKRKWYEQSAIESVVEQLQEQKILDDVLYAELYLQSEVAQKGKSLRNIQQKLYQKWVDWSIVQTLINEHQLAYDEWMSNHLEKLWLNNSWSNQQWIKKMLSRGYPYWLLMKYIDEDNL